MTDKERIRILESEVKSANAEIVDLQEEVRELQIQLSIHKDEPEQNHAA